MPITYWIANLLLVKRIFHLRFPCVADGGMLDDKFDELNWSLRNFCCFIFSLRTSNTDLKLSDIEANFDCKTNEQATYYYDILKVPVHTDMNGKLCKTYPQCPNNRWWVALDIFLPARTCWYNLFQLSNLFFKWCNILFDDIGQFLNFNWSIVKQGPFLTN